MDSDIKNITKDQVKQILQAHGEETEFTITTFLNSDIQFILVNLKAISSTMILSQSWNYDYLHKNRVFLFRAEQQTKGRGQKENPWSSPIGNLSLTILTEVQTHQLILLTIFTSTKICQIISQLFSLPTRLKWINDILCNDKKVGGILVKSNILGDRKIAQIGIGINIKNSPLQTSTCISKETKEPNIDVESFCERLSIKIAVELKTDPQFQIKTIKLYKSFLIYLDQKVNIWDEKLLKILLSGTFVDINQYGFAVIKLQTGENKEVQSGRMRLFEN